MDLAEQIAPNLGESLFDEVTMLNEILAKIPETKFAEISTEKKWIEIFKTDLPNLQILVSKILSIPVSNACVERVFSLCSAQWTDARNSLKVETVKALAQVKVNYDLDCPQMYELLISTPKLLKQIIGGEKYNI
jgi:hypothetical protein